MSLAEILLGLSKRFLDCESAGVCPPQTGQHTAAEYAVELATMESTTCIQDLPMEVFVLIFGNLDSSDLFLALSSESLLWKQLCITRYPWAFNETQKTSTSEYKQSYKTRTLTERKWKAGTAEFSSMTGHSSTVFGVAFLDDERLVSTSDDTSIKVWNIKTKICEMSLPAHNYGILGMYYDKKAQKLITGSYEGTVKTWNINFEKRSKVDKMTIREIKDILRQKRVDFSDCIERPELVSRLLHSRALPAVENHLSFAAHTSTVVGVHSLNNVAATCGRDTYIRLWGLETGEEICRLPAHYNQTSSVQLFDGGLISGGNDAMLNVWDIERKVNTHTLNGHTGWVWSLAYDAATNVIFSGSVDSTVRMWDMRVPKCVNVINQTREVAGIHVDWTRQLLISTGFSGETRIFDYRANKSLAQLRGPRERCTRITANNDAIYTGVFDGSVAIFNFSA